MREVSIGIIGFGTVGSGVVKILNDNADVLKARVGLPIRLKKIADLDLDSDRGVKVDKSVLTTSVEDIFNDPDISIVIELIGGYEPAKTFTLKAIENGKHVITANKALLAEYGHEIFRAAQQAKVDIGFEAAVAGGIPILRSLREGLLANRYEKVLGILNGTCNYILTAMYDNPGVSFDQVLKEAQTFGYAEADPGLDIDGFDTAHKLTLILALTHGIQIKPNQIFVQGIRDIDAFDILMAKEFSYRIKLLALIISHGQDVEARIHPTMIPQSHPLAGVDGVFNGIFLRGDMVGDQLFYGKGAGKEPTASAVVGDIIEIARNVVHGEAGGVPPLGYSDQWKPTGHVLDMSGIRTNYYLRIQAKDQPGVLSNVSGIMADHSISIHSVMQKGRHASATVPVVFLTHRAREADMRLACEKISKLDSIEGQIKILRIEDESLS